MKTKIIVVLLFVFSFAEAQEKYTVEFFPNRYRLSWETVSMSSESDLGFLGIGFDLFHLNKKSSSLYFGLHSYSAMSGIRPGLITLGAAAGWRKHLFKRKDLFLDFGAFVGGGGGGGADDGGGLIIRPHFALEKQFGNIGLQFGVSRIDFPSGTITGNQINFGLTINGANYFKVNKTFEKSSELIYSQSNFQQLRVALVGTQYFNFKEGSTPERPEVEAGQVSLIGAQIERKINSNLYGLLKLNGAFKGGADGYMSILFGAGGLLPIVKNKINIESRLLFGPTGGGAILSGGGATVQAEAGFSIMFKNGYDLKFMGGKTFAPWGAFASNHMEIGIGKTLGQLAPSKKIPAQDIFEVPTKGLIVNHMSFGIYNRTYFSPNAKDKNGILYDSYFNLLGFELQKYISQKWTINAGTVWAYQGSYGAYAEGLLGATYYQKIAPKWNLAFKGMVGAAGGGGIDLGSGLMFQYSLGIERKVSQTGNFYINLGKIQPLKGNFTPYSLDLGFKFDIHQLIKR